MTTRQLFFLCLCNLVTYAVGNAVFALVPVYAIRLGANPSALGTYLAIAFLGMTVASIAAGRLADSLQRRRLQLIVSGLLFSASLLFLRAVSDFSGLVVASVITWALAGIITATITVLTGLFADEARRGGVFGLVATCIPLGLIVAGVTSGPLVVAYGYEGMFLIAAGVSLILPLGALFLQDKVVPVTKREATQTTRFWQGRTFLLILAAYLLATIVSSLPGLVRPLLMSRLEFDEAAISSTVAVAGLVSLPLPFVMGRLSDRLGRKWLLVVCYAANGIGLGFYISAVTIGHFWLAVAVQSLWQGSGGVGPALITDIVPKTALGRALALYGSVPWIGYTIGLFGIGYAIEQFGASAALLGGTGLALASAVLVVVAMRAPRPTEIGVNLAT